jgi:LmbE family N-acetylglucosaminyl deacetylase
MTNTDTRTALFIGAHNDEIEYCAGGLAYHLSQCGFIVHFLNVACKHRVSKKNPHADTIRAAYADAETCAKLRQQDMRAAEVLRAKKMIIGKSDDNFYMCTPDSIRAIIDVVEDIDPDIAFIHWLVDNHFEHSEVAKASFRALAGFSSCEIHAFEAGLWQTVVHFHPDFFINIEPCMEALRESLMVFDQPSASGPWLAKEKEQVATFRGNLSGYRFAEAYKIISFPPGDRSPEMMLPKLLQTDFRWAGVGQYRWGSRYFAEG